ncbi:MAG: aminoglycoside phosphotransferase family protein [Lachnospiraceae bacterium]|nr:aminoglycoside phosphotransferase family protein [Lachnospiraceae bacterium]
MNIMFDYILSQFIDDVSKLSVAKLNSGHINSTYLAESKSGKYVIQCINGNVFSNSAAVIKNAVIVSEHLKKKNPNNVLNYLKAKNGDYFYIDDNQNYWRCYKYVENAITYDSVDDLDIIREVGKAYGEFARNLLDFDVKRLEPTVEGFHDTEKRFEEAKRIFDGLSVDNENGSSFPVCSRETDDCDVFAFEIGESDSSDLKKERNNAVAKAWNLFSLYLKSEDDACQLCKLQRNGQIPLRATHNDTKLNNVLIDRKTGKHSAVIDLDTVMPGLIANDYGDAIRSIAGTGARDEHDLSKVKFDKEKAEAFSEGYLSEIGKYLEREEYKSLKYGLISMTLELGIRYLTDYAEGNKVFKVSYPEENYYRARRLLKLAKEMKELTYLN